jgi:hypothetical protein
MLWFNKAAIDAQLYAQQPVVRISPHRVVVDIIYYHLEVCSNLPICRRANNIIDNVTPPIFQASVLPWFVTRCLAIEDEQSSVTS